LQEYIQQDITPAGTDPNGVGGPVAVCEETILGGRRKTRKTRTKKTKRTTRNIRNKHRKTHKINKRRKH
jgi:hypothetical protein